MKLKQLLKSIPEVQVKGSKEIEISGLSMDSRQTAPGNLFLAKKGKVFQGANFIQQAIEAGASAILTDLYDPFISQTQLIHPHPASIAALIAAAFYQYPSRELFVSGVTGTKGKTTTAHLIKQLLDALECPSGLISTVEVAAGEHRFFSTLTTHDIIFNQKWLREMVQQKCKTACLEVSSHGLEQGRVDEIEWDATIFTNLHADHLDYHNTLESYANAKKKLFSLLDKSAKPKKRAILCADNPWMPFIRKGVKAPIWTFGTDRSADLSVSDYHPEKKGTRCRIHFQGESLDFALPLMGMGNVYNLLAAAAVCLHKGFSLKDLQEVVHQIQGAPGRLERVGEGVFVDYAHTGESLALALITLKSLSPRRIGVVFGCGGDRDPNRRRQMAESAELYADFSIITTDNPRSEEPEKICEEIVLGFRRRERVHVELDRKAAIFYGISQLKEGDILLIAGKGHEKSQIFAHQTFAFDDVQIAKEALKSL